MKFLIDECLSPSLCRLAHRRGFAADAVTWVGKAGWADRELMRLAETQDLTLVTNNSRDFRRLYANLPIHAGLVCLNAPTSLVRRALIETLFDRALDAIEQRADLLNTGHRGGRDHGHTHRGAILSVPAPMIDQVG